jgi:uncharacterized repeat protein (TIGR01451 family)
MARFSTHVPLRQRLLVPLALLTVVAFTVLPILPASAVGNAVDLGVNVTQAGPGAQPVAGSTWTYTIHVTSSGPQASTGYMVRLTIPASTTVGAHDGRCAVTTTVDCTSTGLASPGSETFAVTVNIPSNYANNTHLVTAATITDWNGDIDANPTNDGPAGADAVVITQADLSIQKTGSATPVVPGGSSFTYSLKVTNNGPSDSVGGIVVSDTLPADVTFVSPGVGSSTDAACSASGQNVTCSDGATITAGGTNFRTFVVEVTVDPSHGHGFNDVLLNTASVAPAGGGTTDPNSSNNTSNQDSTNTHPEADLGFTSVSTSPLGSTGDPAVAGQTITYSATVENFGPSDAAAYTLTVATNAGTTFNSGSAGCSASAQVVCNSAGALALNATETFTVTLNVSPSFADGGTFANAVTIVPTTYEGPSPSHANAATPTINVVRKADLGVAASANPDGSPGNRVIAGTNETWTVTVHNYGPSDNSGYTLTLPVPAGTTFVSRTPAAGSSCSPGPGTVTCTHGLAFGVGDDVYTITVFIPSNFANNVPGTQPLSFHTAISGLNPADQNGNANVDFADANLTVVARADLASSAQTATVDAVNPVTGFAAPFPSGNRNTITYTMTVTNGGPSDARDVTVTDTLPAQLDGSTATICVTTGSSCTPTTPYTSGTPVSLITGASPQFLANGASVTVVVRAQVDGSLRGGPFTTGNNTVTFASPTLRTPNGPANSVSTTKTVSFPTVAAAPVLLSVDPGNGQIAVDWKAGPNDGGSSVTGYDIIVKPLPSGTTRFFFFSGNVPTSGTQFTMIVPASTPFLTNGTNYQVTVEARNGAGSSDPSNSINASPCLTCIIKQVSATQVQTLNTGSQTATTCPQKGIGATGTDTYVSCFQFPSNSAKAGLPLALNEGPFQPGACGTDPSCIGNQVVNVNPAGQGTGVVITQYIWVDRTVSTNVFGNPCVKRPCTGGNGTYEYEVFVNGTLVGTSVQKGQPNGSLPWCTTLPSTATACVKSLTAMSSNQAPNGNNGAKDLQIILLLRGDPRIGVSG